jgi:hypothetical protein
MNRQTYHFIDFFFYQANSLASARPPGRGDLPDFYHPSANHWGSYKGLTGVLHTICALAPGLVLFHGTIKRFRLNLVNN